MLAPSGRVRMYAIQNASTGFSPNRQSRVTIASKEAGSRIDNPGPQPVSSSVQSPRAVPSANVTSTASQ